VHRLLARALREAPRPLREELRDLACDAVDEGRRLEEHQALALAPRLLLVRGLQIARIGAGLRLDLLEARLLGFERRGGLP
jgi:hypothetical protein